MVDPRRQPEHSNDLETIPNLQTVPRPPGRIPYRPHLWYDTLGSVVVYLALGAFALLILWALFGH